MNLVIVGHVDHGKSTIIGRLLADTGSLPHGKLDQVRQYCERNAKPFEYAFLLDALKDERTQGITIDAARVFFKTAKRPYVIADAPGHVEFLKNMVTGAARAEAALLVVDAQEGVQENSRRHAYLLSMLGIRQLAVLVNKMDLLGLDPTAFDRIVGELREYLGKVGLKPSLYIPVVGRDGDNLVERSNRMSWYSGPTVLEALDAFEEARPPRQAPFRMPVQDVYKFTARGDSRRIVAGTVESGTARPGDEIVFYPSGKRSRIATIESFPAATEAGLEPGVSRGFTLQEQIYVSRGELAARADQPAPRIGNRVRTHLFWLGKRPLTSGKDYILKLGSARTRARLEHVLKVLDASQLQERSGAQSIERHEVAECVLSLSHPLAFDPEQLTPATSRFVLVDDFEISGGGTVREASEASGPGSSERRFNQRELALIISGDSGICGPLDAALSTQGRTVHCLRADGAMSVERLSDRIEVLLDAGLIVLVDAAGLEPEQIKALGTRLPRDKVRVIRNEDLEAQARLTKDALAWTAPDLSER